MNWDGSNLSVQGGSITGSLFQTATSGTRMTMNATVDADWGLAAYDSSNRSTHILRPDGRTFTTYWSSQDMVIYQTRDSENTNSSPSTLIIKDQAIITDGGTQTHNGYNFGVISYSPLVLGNATKTGTGTLGLGRHWLKNNQVNQVVWSGTQTGNDFAGTLS